MKNTLIPPRTISGVVAAVSAGLAETGRVLVTIDGPCASGKTTIASRIAAVMNCDVIHTDDFVVPHARKTPERLSVPGGNCDWERLVRDVIAPWKNGMAVCFRKYNCHKDCLEPPETIVSDRLLILEGTYCNLPAIREYADIRCFVSTPETVRRNRLEQRETPDLLALFDSRWIPLENAYFDAFGLPDADCIMMVSDGESEPPPVQKTK